MDAAHFPMNIIVILGFLLAGTVGLLAFRRLKKPDRTNAAPKKSDSFQSAALTTDESDEMLHNIREMTAENPARTARIVREWLKESNDE